MHYSKMMLALPVASAAVVAREAQPQVIEYDYVTDVVTQVVTQTGAAVVVTETAGAPAPTDAAPTDAAPSAPAPSAPAASAPVQAQAVPIDYAQVQGHGGHGHASFHSSAAAAAPATTVVAQAPAPSAPAYTPPASSAAAPVVSAAAAPAAAPAPQAGSSSTGGCPADTSGQHLSPGVNGAPSKSMIDSMNYIRRMYNPSANCLTWSDSLASHSDTCAAATSESSLRMNSDIVSAPGYLTSSWYSGKLASSEFERSMIWMLCQSPGDGELQGTCSGKTGEVGCSGAACTGHHDAIVDASNTNHYVGCGHSPATSWISCSFSADQDAPSGYN